MSAGILRFAVIGRGRMGTRRIQAIHENPEAQLACVVDIREDLVRETAQLYGCDYHLDFRDVARRDDVDCVVISVPNGLHMEMAVAMLESRKHVFCEKPLARTAEEARRMVECALANGVTVKTGSNLRYFPSVIKAKEILQTGLIGKPLFARGWIGHEGWNVKGSWYSDPAIAGGGTLLDNGCHLFDLARWLLGEVVECVGMTQTRMWPIEPSEDNGMGILQAVDGTLIFIHASWTEWHGYMYLEIYGSQGSLRIDNRGSTCAVVIDRPREQPLRYDYSQLGPSSYRDEMRAYIKAVQSREVPEASGFDGLRAVQIATGIYESVRTGRRVKVYGEAEEELRRLFQSHPQRQN